MAYKKQSVKQFTKSKPLKALLIIDMQAGSFSAETPRYKAAEVIQRINALSGLFRKQANPVIFVQHDGTREHCFIPGTDDWQLLDELDKSPEDVFLSKTANDTFYDTNLDEFLKTRGIKEVIITGCATDFCVESTIQSALVRDYNVTVISDGHTAADRPHATAKTVIEHYNWVWANLSPTKGKIEVVPFEDFVGMT